MDDLKYSVIEHNKMDDLKYSVIEHNIKFIKKIHKENS